MAKDSNRRSSNQGGASEGLGRRAFIRNTALLGLAGTAGNFLNPFAASSALGAVRPQSTVGQPPSAAAQMDLSDWSYFWLGVKRAHLARGAVVNGEQMYVEYWHPKTVRHPFSIVVVHGGGGQGLDWRQAPDGRPGWATMFVQAGYRVYIVDRPGHGRSVRHPSLQGPFPAQAATFFQTSHQFTAPEKMDMPYGPEAALHNQWPGTGMLGDPTLDQVTSYQGGSFLNDLATTHKIWAERGGELLDKIGPAVIMAHSMGGPSCWIYANARPKLVVGILAVEPAGPPFGAMTYGVAASPLEYDPPVADPADLKTVDVKPTEAGRAAYKLQAEPARKLKNLKMPIALITSQASYHWPYDQGTVAFLRQAGCTVDHIELDKLGITGNGHFMMMEKNNREILAQMLKWLDAKVTVKGAPAAADTFATRAPGAADETPAMQLSDQGYFWVGNERKEMPYGVIAGAPMFVQYMIPTQVRHETPIVLVHGDGGSMLNYMGSGDGAAGWAHFYVQAGYKVYLVDRPGYGRCVYHPDGLGSIGQLPTYEDLTADTLRGAKGGQWPGSGDVGDMLVDQLMASQKATAENQQLLEARWRVCGAALLDKLGPVVLQTHSSGGSFGWIVANERPKMVKALVSFEGTGAPLVAQRQGRGGDAGGGAAAPQLNLSGIPVAYFAAENSGRAQGQAIVDALNRSGADAELIQCKDRGVHGNGHYAMLEKNRKQVFDLIQGWVDKAAG